MLIAILLGEPEAEHLATAIAAADRRLVSALTLLEAGAVIEARKDAAGGRELDLLFHRAGIDVVPVNIEQSELARSAWRTFGRGHHSAGLNLGDTCAYALARYSGEPLLYNGNDFDRPDVATAAY